MRKHWALFIAAVAVAMSAGAADLAALQAILERDVGGRWQIETNETWVYLAPKELPPQLGTGTFAVFASSGERDAVEAARGWMAICQAPFSILGSNSECVVVTYVPPDHTVSQAVLHALGLNEAEPSPP